MNLDMLGLQIASPLVHPGAKNFRPPTWPPLPDWAPVLDAEGIAQCVYSDSTWPLDVWAGKPLKISFGDGKTKGAKVSSENADLLRQCVVWFMWGPRGRRTAGALATNVLGALKPLFVACTKAGIVATDLVRFEAVIDKVAAALSPSKFDHAITVLHELLDARVHLGFCLLDIDGLARMVKLRPSHKSKQTPYIPARIWSYQLSRLRECLDDFAKHQAQVVDCFEFCLNAYAHNYGSLNQAINSKPSPYRTPFTNQKSQGNIKYHGSFKLTADRFKLTDLIEKWVGPFAEGNGRKQIVRLSQYLDLVSMAGLAYLLNFSIMRIEEGWNLRSDCLLVERDKKFGDIYILCGETTKTDPDADARWTACKSVTVALDALKCIAALRIRCAVECDEIGLTAADEANPYLISLQYEPWGPGGKKSYRTRPHKLNYQQVLDSCPHLLDRSQIVIDKEDLRAARLITPSLDADVFKEGEPWRFAWHQLRRTGVVNMLSSEMVDESSLQLQLKHQARAMVLYYGRNHSRLNLNEEARCVFLKTMYEEIGRDLEKLSSPQFVSPVGQGRKEAIVTFIKESDALSLDRAAKQGKVGARRIRAGFCVNHRACPYGGVEAISHCLGGDGGKGCPDLLVDIEKEANIKLYEKIVDAQLNNVHVESPRYRSLQSEKRAIERFYEVVQTQDR